MVSSTQVCPFSIGQSRHLTQLDLLLHLGNIVVVVTGWNGKVTRYIVSKMDVVDVENQPLERAF